MSAQFDRDVLQQGDVLHVWGVGWLSAEIEHYLNDGSHDAILLLQDGVWRAGDATVPRCKLTPLTDYEAQMGQGVRCAVYRPAGATPDMGAAAAAWWLANVNGRPYDPLVFLHVILWHTLRLKYLFPNWQFGYWCTQGVADAWAQGAGLDVWHEAWPTPLTTEKRVQSGDLAAVSGAIAG